MFAAHAIKLADVILLIERLSLVFTLNVVDLKVCLNP